MNNQAETASAVPAGATILDMIESFIKRYMILPEGAAFVCALYCIATHLYQQFDVFPYLAIGSPVKRCGKTRLADILSLFMFKPENVVDPTSAAIYRMLGGKGATLVIDEAEALQSQNDAMQTIQGILNRGFQKGGSVPRWNAEAHKMEYLPVYGPKVIVLIGAMKDTLADRSIHIRMQRRKPNEKPARFLLSRDGNTAKPIKKAIESWTNVHAQDVKSKYWETLDLPFLQDREADLWLSLFAVCAIASPNRIGELESVAKAFASAKEEADLQSTSKGIRLLTAVWQIFSSPGFDKADGVATDSILHVLNATESDWAKLDARRLGRYLQSYGVRSQNIRLGERVFKGYKRADVADAYGRYGPRMPISDSAEVAQGVSFSDLSATSATRHIFQEDTAKIYPLQKGSVADEKSHVTHSEQSLVADVADKARLEGVCASSQPSEPPHTADSVGGDTDLGGPAASRSEPSNALDTSQVNDVTPEMLDALKKVVEDRNMEALNTFLEQHPESEVFVENPMLLFRHPDWKGVRP